jgi:hypothetical protein
MEQQKVNVERMNKYCVIREQEVDRHIDRHCTPSSVVAIKGRVFRKRNRFFTLSGKELNEESLFHIRETKTVEQAIDLLKNKNMYTRLAAVVALEKLGCNQVKMQMEHVIGLKEINGRVC